MVHKCWSDSNVTEQAAVANKATRDGLDLIVHDGIQHLFSPTTHAFSGSDLIKAVYYRLLHYYILSWTPHVSHTQTTFVVIIVFNIICSCTSFLIIHAAIQFAWAVQKNLFRHRNLSSRSHPSSFSWSALLTGSLQLFDYGLLPKQSPYLPTLQIRQPHIHMISNSRVISSKKLTQIPSRRVSAEVELRRVLPRPSQVDAKVTNEELRCLRCWSAQPSLPRLKTQFASGKTLL